MIEAKILRSIALSVLMVIVFIIPAQAGNSRHLVFLGDSITAGFGVEAGKSYPEQLHALINEDEKQVTISNAGVSGDTSAGGLARLNWSIGEDVDGVVLALGANDALRGLPVEQTRNNLENIILQLKERKIPVLLVGMLSPPNMGEDYEASFNAIFPKLASTHELVFYPFLLDGVAAQKELNQADGIHPNIEGMSVIAKKIRPFVEQFLEQIQ